MGWTEPAQTVSDASDVSSILREIENNSADMKTLRASFIQSKYLSSFEEAIVLKGELLIDKVHDLLAWHVREPLRYSVLISKDSIKQWDEEVDKVQELSLSRIPLLRSMLEQMKLWFSGDYQSLSRDYDAEVLEKSPAMIRFYPKKGASSQMSIKSVTIRFMENGLYLDWIKIEDTSGDSTTVDFQSIEFNAPLSEKDFRLKISYHLRPAGETGTLCV